MKNKERLIWASVVVALLVAMPTHSNAEWDTFDASQLRDLRADISKQTKAQEWMARSLETIAKNCKN